MKLFLNVPRFEPMSTKSMFNTPTPSCTARGQKIVAMNGQQYFSRIRTHDLQEGNQPSDEKLIQTKNKIRFVSWNSECSFKMLLSTERAINRS